MSYSVVAAVKKLLSQYAEYVNKNEQLAIVERKLALAVIAGKNQEALSNERDNLRQELRQISDDMTFDSPYIWIQYKYEAYKNEAQPILTMQDLRVHCSAIGYICTKRFQFLNNQLVKRGKHPLSDQASYPDNVSLEALLSNDNLVSLSRDKEFMDQWRAYEYYEENGRVAKWENFQETAK